MTDPTTLIERLRELANPLVASLLYVATIREKFLESADALESLASALASRDERIKELTAERLSYIKANCEVADVNSGLNTNLLDMRARAERAESALAAANAKLKAVEDELEACKKALTGCEKVNDGMYAEQKVFLAERDAARASLSESQAEVAKLRKAIEDHNHGCYMTCGKYASIKRGHCDAYIRRGMQCPDCPMDDLIECAALDTQDNYGSKVMWQPIETAPKDGTWILAIDKDGYISQCQWRRPNIIPGDDREVLGGIGWQYASWAMPTHWMPLPALPSLDTPSGAIQEETQGE